MSISILNNIPSLEAQNALSMTQNNLNNTLEQLSTGQRINSGADDAAGLAALAMLDRFHYLREFLGQPIDEVALDELHCLNAHEVGALAGDEIIHTTHRLTARQ